MSKYAPETYLAVMPEFAIGAGESLMLFDLAKMKELTPDLFNSFTIPVIQSSSFSNERKEIALSGEGYLLLACFDTGDFQVALAETKYNAVHVFMLRALANNLQVGKTKQDAYIAANILLACSTKGIRPTQKQGVA